jgi:exonuclease VII large subunit
VGDARSQVAVCASRLVPLSLGHLGRADDRTEGWRRLLAAYDVDRQLERGYTLTVDDSGRVVRSVAEVAAGSAITTKFSDGTARSVVESVASRAGVGETGA